jgi:Ca2+-binding RTX toxin-like protein
MQRGNTVIEPLEARRLFAADVTLSAGILRVRGTESADTIVIAPNASESSAIEIRVGSLLKVYNLSDIKFIRINSGGGADQVTLGASVHARSIIYAGAGDDIVTGGAGRDRIHAGDGNDSILGGRGNDVLMGEAGQDTLIGGRGGDVLFGGPDDDTLFGNEGDDTLHGGDGIDQLDGGAGDDVISEGI